MYSLQISRSSANMSFFSVQVAYWDGADRFSIFTQFNFQECNIFVPSSLYRCSSIWNICVDWTMDALLMSFLAPFKILYYLYVSQPTKQSRLASLTPSSLICSFAVFYQYYSRLVNYIWKFYGVPKIFILQEVSKQTLNWSAKKTVGFHNLSQHHVSSVVLNLSCY